MSSELNIDVREKCSKSQMFQTGRSINLPEVLENTI